MKKKSPPYGGEGIEPYPLPLRGWKSIAGGSGDGLSPSPLWGRFSLSLCISHQGAFILNSLAPVSPMPWAFGSSYLWPSRRPDPAKSEPYNITPIHNLLTNYSSLRFLKVCTMTMALRVVWETCGSSPFPTALHVDLLDWLTLLRLHPRRDCGVAPPPPARVGFFFCQFIFVLCQLGVFSVRMGQLKTFW